MLATTLPGKKMDLWIPAFAGMTIWLIIHSAKCGLVWRLGCAVVSYGHDCFTPPGQNYSIIFSDLWT